MNPLSPFTYYRRHKRAALLLVSLVALVTLGVYAMVGMLNSLLGNSHVLKNHLTRFSLVYPFMVSSEHIADIAQIRVHPDVARVIPARKLYLLVPYLVASDSFPLLGAPEDDMQTLLDTCDLRLREGRLPQSNTSEITLSEEIANALGLQVGDRISRSINECLYANLPTEFVLAGILENDPNKGSRPAIRLGLASYEYIASHELYREQAPTYIIIPKEGRKVAMDGFLENEVQSPSVEVDTYGQVAKFFDRMRWALGLVLGVVDCLVAIVVAIVVGVINRIALARRLSEFGLMHALGYDRKRLTRRITLETAVAAGIGWVVGLVLSWLLFSGLKTNIYQPKGLELSLLSLTPLLFTLPIPLSMVCFVAISISRAFARLDSVAIIERGKLSMETKEQKTTQRSSTKPLSSRTFYRRHRLRGILLIAAMSLMILGTAFPVFFFMPMVGAQKPLEGHLRYATRVSSVRGELDPGVTAQIRSHPDVAQVIPYSPNWMAVSIPPLSETGFQPYGVSEENLPILLDLFELELEEGRLPHPNAAEVVLTEPVALNRGLSVGDKVGRPVYERDGFPVEMEVVGILSTQDGLWLGFSPLEYQVGDERFATGAINDLLVVPVEGRKEPSGAWLEENIASPHVEVETYETALRRIQEGTRSMLLLFAGVESVIAVVAAIALAVLNYIFFTQRREEFGILHAMGRSRRRLILRTTRETMSAISIAWLIGAAVCTTGLLLAQASVYAPKGLQLDIFSAGPWLFTLPIPIAVVAAGAGTIAWALSRLDPVSVIERR